VAVAIVTGSAGLIGSESVRHFSRLGMDVVGIDNDMRQTFFGAEASTAWQREQLEREVPGYRHVDLDIRDRDAVFELFRRYGNSIGLIIHAAAQPSHDWAAREPFTDFSVNAAGTLTLLEAARELCPGAVFIFTSTNKVYGDRPNQLPLVEQDTRWELAPGHEYSAGIDESMSIDQCTHSLFGASKAAADLMVQEYGRYFGMATAVFRGGCLTGPSHSGTQLHGFLAYLMKCTVTQTPYTVFGYKAKQVRDNIHSSDLVRAFEAVFAEPGVGDVFNIGGGREVNCSMLEAIALCEELSGKALDWRYADENRTGDHIWYVSDLTRFRTRYPAWRLDYSLRDILQELHDQNLERWTAG